MKAKKHLGQNFLIDDSISYKIANFFDVSGENIIEVGPGRGALTKEILKNKPKQLHLVEFDKDMIHILESQVKSGELDIHGVDFHIFHQDVLTFIPSFQEYYVIANIPYYITSPILFHFLYDVEYCPQKMLIMMQKEVGERILEINKEKRKNSLLSLAMSKKCIVKKVCDVPKTAFSPKPKVDSMVLSFEKHSQYNDIDDQVFVDFLKKCFTEPRKTLVNNLQKSGFDKQGIQQFLLENGFSEKMRAEELGLDYFLHLMRTVFKT